MNVTNLKSHIKNFHVEMTSLNTAIRLCGHLRKVCAESVSSRQKEANHSAETKSVIMKDKNR